MKQYHNKKVLIASTLIVILVLVVGGLLLKPHQLSTKRTHNQTILDNNKKEAVINNNGSPVGDSGVGTSKGSPSNDTYHPPTTNSGITIETSTSGTTVVIATKLVGYIDGECTLTVTNGVHSNTQSADVIFAPDYSSCAGFTIPKSELGSGTWNIVLSVTSDNITTSKSTSYEVSP